MISKKNHNGLLLVDKPTGVTSHDVVDYFRKKLQRKDIGHAGTLDPMATGLLVLLLGEATKISDCILSGYKTYRLKVQLGVETDTLDKDGQVLSRKEVALDRQSLRTAALNLVGDFSWPAPAFSAVKVNGQKLYERARRSDGITPLELKRPMKPMSFWGVDIVEVTPSTIEAVMSCSKGSYIRSWAYQLGQNLGVGGCLFELRRLRSEPFDVQNAYNYIEKDEIELIYQSNAFIPLALSLPHLMVFNVRGRDEKLLMNGQISYDLQNRLLPEQKHCNFNNLQRIIQIKNDSNDLIGLIRLQPHKPAQIKRVFKA